MTAALSAERYLQFIDDDTEKLIDLGSRGLKAPVPALEGWDVAEVLWHVAGVFEHKVRVMADNAWPDPWPPAEFEDKEEIAFLRQAKTDLFEEFSRHDPSEQTTTFWRHDTTIRFWIRRMALEVAVHRYDGEQAHGDPTEIPADESLDGIDELLHVFVDPGDGTHVSTEHPVDAVVSVESGGRRWVCDLSAASVAVRDDTHEEAQATVAGEPMAVFLWLWGRVGDHDITVSGDATTVQEFRARLVECTQ